MFFKEVLYFLVIQEVLLLGCDLMFFKEVLY